MKKKEWRSLFEEFCLEKECDEDYKHTLCTGTGGQYIRDLCRQYEKAHDKTGIMFGIVAGSIVIVLVLIVAIPWLKSYFCADCGIKYCIRKGKEVNVDQAFDAELQLDAQKIDVEKEVASGSFGTVYRGVYKMSSGGVYAIALKTVRLDVEKGREKDRERLELLKKEGVKMKNFNHEHVLSLKGIVFIKNNFCLVFKWMDNGALNSYVRRHRTLSRRQLLSFCTDIASGMTYLAKNNVFHRDLAARNCLLDHDLSVKVSDFGLSRGKDDAQGHFSSRHSILRNVPLPLKWMSPESLEHSFFDERTDVWSFGITMWEIFNHGSIPWNKVPTEISRFVVHLKKGNKPKKTASFPDDLYEIMSTCLELNKWDRKPFAELREILARLRDAEPPDQPPKYESDDDDEVFKKKRQSTPTRRLTRTATWLKPKPKEKETTIRNQRYDSIMTMWEPSTSSSLRVKKSLSSSGEREKLLHSTPQAVNQFNAQNQYI